MIKHVDFTTYQVKHKKYKMKREGSCELNVIKFVDVQSYREQSDDLIDTILNEKQIYAVYQGINNIESEEIYGYEGLTRTTNPNISSIIELIELADSKGKLHELDLIMMETVIRNFKRKGNLFINMEYKSPELIKEYIEKMVQIANEMGIETDKIVIEVSERKQWKVESINTLNNLKVKNKFLIAVDDFGSGYANIHLLLNLNPDIVKIDRSLVCNINENKKKYEFLKALIELIKKQNMKIIFEGIEVTEELKVLRTISQEYGQGWYFGRPERHDND